MKLVVILLLTLANISQARVGEPYEDLKKRIGNAVSSFSEKDSLASVHEKDGIEITVFVEKGVIIREMYENLRVSEARSLLAKQYEGIHITKDEKEHKLWATPDKTIFAQWNFKDNTLHVTHAKLWNEEALLKFNKLLGAEKRLEGL